MKKKITLVLVTCLTMLTLLSGCKAKEDDIVTTTPKPTTTTAPRETTTTEDLAINYDLVFKTWWTNFSDYYEIKDGDKLTFNISAKAATLAKNNYDHWVMILANMQEHSISANAGYIESIAIRPDNFGWGTDYVPARFTFSRNGSVMTETGWTNWLADIKRGTESTLIVSRDGATFTFRCTIVSGENTYQYNGSWVTTLGLADSMYIFFSGESSGATVTLVEE